MDAGVTACRTHGADNGRGEHGTDHRADHDGPGRDVGSADGRTADAHADGADADANGGLGG